MKVLTRASCLCLACLGVFLSLAAVASADPEYRGFLEFGEIEGSTSTSSGVVPFEFNNGPEKPSVECKEEIYKWGKQARGPIFLVTPSYMGCTYKGKAATVAPTNCEYEFDKPTAVKTQYSATYSFKSTTFGACNFVITMEEGKCMVELPLSSNKGLGSATEWNFNSGEKKELKLNPNVRLSFTVPATAKCGPPIGTEGKGVILKTLSLHTLVGVNIE